MFREECFQVVFLLLLIHQILAISPLKSSALPHENVTPVKGISGPISILDLVKTGHQSRKQTRVATSDPKDNVEKSNVEWDADKWIELWNTSVEKQPGNPLSKAQSIVSSLQDVHKSTTLSSSISNEKPHKDNSEWNIDELIQYWEELADNKSRHQITETQNTDSPLENIQKTITASVFAQNKDLDRHNSDPDVDEWIKFWETQEDSQASNTFPGSQKTDSPLQDGQRANAISTSNINEKPDSVFQDTNFISTAQTEENDTDKRLSTNPLFIQSREMSTHSSGAEPNTKVDQSEDLATQPSNAHVTVNTLPPSKTLKTSESVTSTSTSFHGSKLQRSSRLSLKHSSSLQTISKSKDIPTEASVLAESANGLSSDALEPTKLGTPTSTGVAPPKTMAQKLDKEADSDSLHESKAPTEHDAYYELSGDSIIFITIFSVLSVGLIILLIFLIFCVCCKKQAKGFPDDTKNMTTLNSDGNRIDLQILRPSKASIDAFTFGLPISSLDESLKSVVVEAPYLKY